MSKVLIKPSYFKMRPNILPFHFTITFTKQCMAIVAIFGLLPILVIYFGWNKESYRFQYSEDVVAEVPNQIDSAETMNWIEKVEERMEARRKLLKQKCSELGLDKTGNDALHQPRSNEYLVNRKHHLVWCHIFKSASSSWLYNFNILVGYSPRTVKMETDRVFDLARAKYPRVHLDELRAAQNDSMTFIIVRDPFQRFLSAYRDKFQYASKRVEYYMQLTWLYRNRKKSKEYISFSNFVSWFLNLVDSGGTIDVHLRSYTSFCTPCLIKIDVIAKFETLEEDQNYIIEKAGLRDLIKPQAINSAWGLSTKQLVDTYFSQLSRKQIDGLYNFYRYDFEITGYNVSPYYDLVETKERSANFKPTS